MIFEFEYRDKIIDIFYKSHIYMRYILYIYNEIYFIYFIINIYNRKLYEIEIHAKFYAQFFLQ